MHSESGSTRQPYVPALHLALFLTLVAATVTLFWAPVRAATVLALDDYRYEDIMVAPILCAVLLYVDRKEILSKARFAPGIGIPILSLTVLLSLLLTRSFSGSDQIARLFPIILGVVFTWLAAFVVCYGIASFRIVMFPLCLLFLAAPIPPNIIDSLSATFQNLSAEFSFALLNLFGVSVFRQGTMFTIPGLDFTIAPECSGIRSAFSFLIVALVAGRFFLRAGWTRLALVVSTVPITTFKNAVRIAVTTYLGAYVNRAFIDGPFHHQYGGIVFAPIDLLLFVPFLLGLRKLETQSLPAAEPDPGFTPGLGI